MNWDNLRENRCPKCGRRLNPKLVFGMFHCIDVICNFMITPKRFKDIVNSPKRYKSEKHYRPLDEEPE